MTAVAASFGFFVLLALMVAASAPETRSWSATEAESSRYTGGSAWECARGDGHGQCVRISDVEPGVLREDSRRALRHRPI